MAAAAATTNSSRPGAQNEWQTGLFEVWTDISLNWLVCFCPACAYADSVTRLDGRYAAWCPPCFAHMCSTLILSCALVGADTRRQIRETFQLPQQPFNDYVVHCLFCFCALCQEAREIKYRSQLVAPSSLAAQLIPATDAPEVQLVTRSKSKAVSLREWEWRPNSSTSAGAAGAAGAAPMLVPLQQQRQQQQQGPSSEACGSRAAGGRAGRGESPGRPPAPGPGPSRLAQAGGVASRVESSSAASVSTAQAAVEAAAEADAKGGAGKVQAEGALAAPPAGGVLLEEGEVEILPIGPASSSSSTAMAASSFLVRS